MLNYYLFHKKHTLFSFVRQELLFCISESRVFFKKSRGDSRDISFTEAEVNTEKRENIENLSLLFVFFKANLCYFIQIQDGYLWLY